MQCTRKLYFKRLRTNVIRFDSYKYPTSEFLCVSPCSHLRLWGDHGIRNILLHVAKKTVQNIFPSSLLILKMTLLFLTEHTYSYLSLYHWLGKCHGLSLSRFQPRASLPRLCFLNITSLSSAFLRCVAGKRRTFRRIISPTSSRLKILSLPPDYAIFLLDLFFDPEDRGDVIPKRLALFHLCYVTIRDTVLFKVTAVLNASYFQS